MVNNTYSSASEACREIGTKVRKVGGDNACRFIENSENIREGNLDAEKQVLVFSAIRSSDRRHDIFRLPLSGKDKDKPGFNTTSHLIEMAKLLKEGRKNESMGYLESVANFTKQIVFENMEPEFQETICNLINEEALRLMEKLEEASQNTENISVFGTEYIYKKEGEIDYTSFTGFGEILCQKIYAEYLKLKGFKVAQLDAEENAMHVFGDDPAEAMEHESEKITQLRNIYGRQLKDIFDGKEKPDVVITGGWEAITATMRSYTDKKAALIAQALKKLGFDILYVNEKKDQMLSADPAILSEDPEDIIEAQTVDRMNYGFLKELTGSRGADTTVLHSDVAQMLEDYQIPTAIINPFDPSSEGTLVTHDYMPEEDGSELIASKPIKSALTIKSGNMPDQEAVMDTISAYFAKLSIDAVHTTNNTVFLTFDRDVSEAQKDELQGILDKKFAAKYTLNLRKDLAFVFCLGNNMDAIMENALGTLALREAKIRPLRLHAVDEESVVAFLVQEKDRKRAVRVLHKALITSPAHA